MEKLKTWFNNLFESMATAFVHPFHNSVPPNIGAHSYSHRPIRRRNRRLWSS